MAAPAFPPTIAPRIAPAIVPTSYGVAFVAWAVPCRSATWLSSCAITPATSPSVLAASIIPRLTYMGPPGSAKALISFTLTTLKVYRNSGCLSSAGIESTRRCPMSSTYDVTSSSLSSGNCFSTCAAASLPSFTSSLGLYLFFGGVIFVCAPTKADRQDNRRDGHVCAQDSHLFITPEVSGCRRLRSCIRHRGRRCRPVMRNPCLPERSESGTGSSL